MEISVTLIMLFQLHYVFLIDTHNSSTKCNHIFSEKRRRIIRAGRSNFFLCFVLSLLGQEF